MTDVPHWEIKPYYVAGDIISPVAFPDIVLAASDFMPPVGQESEKPL